ncbi:hypothetical protein P8C59_006991 [Phyllachora maydis]|uniref:N-acetyltransferase domain-containing protein n=1 Tax=Phyllachora maydis TaxID=1825666 RepID=A0AAD9I973_9PEZI|nr:hypothetical protein P8C59_006991 [Phyllachora maydis]
MTSTSTDPILVLTKSTIRPYRPSDAPAIPPEADNVNIARHMPETFPSPYTLEAASAWIRIATTPQPVPGPGPRLTHFAVCCGAGPRDTVCGGIGLKPLGNGLLAHTMELGYWLGEAHWGGGVMTEAVAAFARWAFAAVPGLRRLEAVVFEGNGASAAVLERAGFVLEGRRRRAGCKAGRVFDLLMYGLLREEISTTSY